MTAALAQDQATFRASFDESIQDNSELHTYVRLKCNSIPSSQSLLPKDMLFEIKGRSRSAELEGVFFLATAKTYPSRNVEMRVLAQAALFLFSLILLQVEHFPGPQDGE